MVGRQGMSRLDRMSLGLPVDQMREHEVHDVLYADWSHSLVSPSGNVLRPGWLTPDGKVLPRDKYPDLYAALAERNG